MNNILDFLPRISLALVVVAFLASACASQESPEGSGEVPDDLMDEIRRDLAARLEIDVGTIEVARAEQAIWNDGSLGCPIPGQIYTQAIVDGYWVVLVAAGKEYDYRATDRGVFILCEQPQFGEPPIG